MLSFSLGAKSVCKFHNLCWEVGEEVKLKQHRNKCIEHFLFCEVQSEFHF